MNVMRLCFNNCFEMVLHMSDIRMSMLSGCPTWSNLNMILVHDLDFVEYTSLFFRFNRANMLLALHFLTLEF